MHALFYNLLYTLVYPYTLTKLFFADLNKFFYFILNKPKLQIIPYYIFEQTNYFFPIDGVF